MASDSKATQRHPTGASDETVNVTVPPLVCDAGAAAMDALVHAGPGATVVTVAELFGPTAPVGDATWKSAVKEDAGIAGPKLSATCRLMTAAGKSI